MRIQDHIERVQAFERALVKLNPRDNTQLFVWFLEKAGAHCMNAALHAWGLTKEIPEGASIVEPQDKDAEWEDAGFYKKMARSGDLIHTRFKPKSIELTLDAEILFERLLFIEEERARYVRGIEPLNEKMLTKFNEAYKTIRSLSPVPGESPL